MAVDEKKLSTADNATASKKTFSGQVFRLFFFLSLSLKIAVLTLTKILNRAALRVNLTA